MSNKFETLLDYIVNEEMDKANELFHDIVVEKSREIYENLIAEEEDEEQQDEARDEEEDESVDEVRDEEEDESVEEGFGDDQESSFEIGGEEDGGLGGDPSDDMVSDVEDDAAMGDMDGEEDGDAPATKDDINDLADSLDQLKAEFQALLDGEKHEEEGDPDVHGGALDDLESDAGDDDMGGDEEDAEAAFMREYREVVGKPYGGGKVAGKTEESSTNTMSTVSSGKGKPTTGATAGNIVQKSEGDKNETGKTGGLVGGLKSGDLTRSVEVNMDGKQTGVKKLAKVSDGHGAEKKGAGPGPVGSGSGDKAGQTSVPANKTFLKKL